MTRDSRETALSKTDVKILHSSAPHRFFSSLVFATVAPSAPPLGQMSTARALLLLWAGLLTLAPYPSAGGAAAHVALPSGSTNASSANPSHLSQPTTTTAADTAPRAAAAALKRFVLLLHVPRSGGAMVRCTPPQSVSVSLPPPRSGPAPLTHPALRGRWVFVLRSSSGLHPARQSLFSNPVSAFTCGPCIVSFTECHCAATLCRTVCVCVWVYVCR